MLTMNSSVLFKLLGDLTAGLLEPGTSPNFAKVGLFTNNYTPLPTTVIGDLTEAAYTGYAQLDVPAWGDPSTVSATEVNVLGTTILQFQGPSSGPGAIIYGYFWLDSTGSYIGAERFSSPIPLNVLTDVITLLPSF